MNMGLREAVARFTHPEIAESADRIQGYLNVAETTSDLEERRRYADLALAEVREHIERDPTHPVVLWTSAKIKIKFNNDYENALKDLEAINLKNRRTKRIINQSPFSEQIKQEVPGFKTYGYLLTGQDDKALDLLYSGVFPVRFGKGRVLNDPSHTNFGLALLYRHVSEEIEPQRDEFKRKEYQSLQEALKHIERNPVLAESPMLKRLGFKNINTLKNQIAEIKSEIGEA